MSETIWKKKSAFPFEYCKLDRASELLDLPIYDLLYLAEKRKIELCLKFNILDTIVSFVFFKKEWISLVGTERRNAVNSWLSQRYALSSDFNSLPSTSLTQISLSIEEYPNCLEANFDDDSLPLCSMVDGFLCIDSPIDSEKLLNGQPCEFFVRFKPADVEDDEQFYLMRLIIHGNRKTDKFFASDLWITRKQIEIVYSLKTRNHTSSHPSVQGKSSKSSGRPENIHKNRILGICSETRIAHPDAGLKALPGKVRKYLQDEGEKGIPTEETIINWLKIEEFEGARHNKKIEFELVIPDKCRGNN